MKQDEILLETRGLTLAVGGHVALDRVDLRLRAGRLHALLGPPGAGKTCCLELLAKSVLPSAGRILFKGEDITREKAAVVARRGIVRAFPAAGLFPHMTVRENLRRALQRRLDACRPFWSPECTRDALDARAGALLRELGLEEEGEMPAMALGPGGRRALAIAAGFAAEPELVLLDAPLQGLAPQEAQRIRALVRRVAAGRAVLLTARDPAEVEDLADTVTVLRHGALLAEDSAAALAQDPAVTEACRGGGERAAA